MNLINFKILFFSISFLLIVFFSSCNKNKKIVKRLEGTWTLTEKLLNDGQRIYPGGTFVFEAGKTDGKTFSNYANYNANYTDTVNGEYLVADKGSFLILVDESQPSPHTDSCIIEDMDKESLVIRMNSGVLFLKKE